MSKRRTYLHNAALLTGSGLVLRALGMGFRIVLAAYLGSEGMGLYQLILALYMVFVSFATAGVNVASARLAAQSLARGSGMAETLRGLCITALGFGTAAMLAQSVLAGPCARYLLHDVRAETALLILAPSLPFMAVSGAVRGCFLAARRVQPNITAQLIEQLVRMAVAVAGLRVLAQWGAGYGCAAVLLGNTVSANGSVSRGICVTDESRNLVSVTERTCIEPYADGIHYSEDGGKSWADLPADCVVSMNLWGFTPAYVQEAKAGFAAFLQASLPVNPMKCEYYLPTVVTNALEAGKADVHVLTSADKWHGITYREDKPELVEALKKMSEDGLYPVDRLF